MRRGGVAISLALGGMAGVSQSPLWRLVAKNARTIVPLGGDGEATPLYCVHSIAGEVTSFRLMAEKIGTDRCVYGIQAPKDRMSGDFASSVAKLAGYYADKLCEFQPDGPVMLAGWSAGAILALEMAQILKAKGREVEFLVALDGILYNTGAEISRWNPLYYWKVAGNLPRWIADNVASGWGISGVYNRLKRELKLNLASLTGQKAPRGSTVDAFMDTSILPAEQAAFARALFAALEDYVPKPYDGRVLLYAAKTQPLLHLLQVEAAWAKIANRVETLHLEGTHLAMVREPQVSRLVEHFRERLDGIAGPIGQVSENVAKISGTPAAGYSSLQSGA
jgi:thioesterase domain-containing protein